VDQDTAILRQGYVKVFVHSVLCRGSKVPHHHLLFSVFALTERKNGKQKRGKYSSAKNKTPTA
jgi:hypothetical protein